MSDVPFGIEDNQHSVVAITFADAAGNPVAATIDAGSLSVTSSDPASLAATPDEAASSFTCTAAGALDVDVTVDVTCSVNGTAFNGAITFAVGASAPTSLVLTPATPVDN